MKALSLSIALASLFFFAPAQAEIVAVCRNSAQPEPASYGSAAVLNLMTPKKAESDPTRSQLALWHDAKGFDVLLNWGEKNQRSLRAEDAEIMGNDIDGDLIHLVVVRAGLHSLEHFLFSWDAQPVGELLWTAPDEGRNGDAPYQMACVKPKH